MQWKRSCVLLKKIKKTAQRDKDRTIMSKEKAIIEMVIRWLDSNIDEPPPEGVQEDSANLKEKIELALDPKATIEDIEAGNV